MNRIDKCNLNSIQNVAVELIQEDMSFLYTLVINREKISPTYWVELSPYLGLIIDGVEDWIKVYNNSSKNKIEIPLFSDEEEIFYERLRIACKLWGYSLYEFYDLLNEKYQESDKYFGSLCKKIAKELHLYDTMGVFFIDGYCCGNTILDACFVPEHRLYFSETNGAHIKKMAEFAGRYIASLGINKAYSVSIQKYDLADYGGFIKVPFGNQFSIKHVLFACLCMINFVLYGIEGIIKDEISTKLRIEYICYYYMEIMLSQVKKEYGIDIIMSKQYISRELRNSLAHYKLGVALKKEELIQTDPLKGLIQKYVKTDYYELKKWVIQELSDTEKKIEQYLGTDKWKKGLLR